ncbi:hypothetical protein F383_36322 [Gossypium arboreum]|uniref:Uncharacterized protein n=1 Tax=Gossypium arboreum TaxID=29729 RepID=A0A0B0Q1U0_GOSAR|nr:hypothetical protein F383_36322 [Gossypium arboreum]
MPSGLSLDIVTHTNAFGT